MHDQGKSELTLRAVASGLVVGCLIGASNVGIGLKIGIVFGSSILCVILAFAFFRSIRGWTRHPFTPKETLIASTTGSAASFMASAAGLTAAIPALEMLGVTFSYWQLVLWGASVATLGVAFVVPLRRSMVAVDKLRFPTGTASAETITALFADKEDGRGRARWLLVFGLAASLLTVLFSLEAAGLGRYQDLGLDDIGLGGLTLLGVSVAALRIGVSFSPMIWGAGILVGPRVGWSMLGGSLLAWLVLAPILLQAGVVSPAGPGQEFKAAFAWLIWPGVSLMVFAGLTGLALQYRTILRTFKALAGRGSDEDAGEDAPDPVPLLWWLAGLAAAASATVILCWLFFDIKPWLSALAIFLSFVLCAIAVRAVGETDVNPSGPMSKITQLMYGLLDPGLVTTNVMAANITLAGASQGADMMSDLKAGYLLKASVRRQVLAQLIGVIVAIFVVAGVYKALTAAYPVPGEKFTAPSAQSWRAMAKVLSEGLSTIPDGALEAAALAGVLGVLLTLLGRVKRIAGTLPSPVAVGIAFLLAPCYATGLWMAALLVSVWKRRRPDQADRFGTSVAAGLIAGEGITMVVVALLIVFGVPGV